MVQCDLLRLDSGLDSLYLGHSPAPRHVLPEACQSCLLGFFRAAMLLCRVAHNISLIRMAKRKNLIALTFTLESETCPYRNVIHFGPRVKVHRLLQLRRRMI